MTDRHAGYLLTLEEDVRSDDAERILNALRMVKGVLHVEPIVSDTAVKMAENRVRSEVYSKLHEVARGFYQ